MPNIMYKYENSDICRKISHSRYAGYSKGKKYLIYGKMLRMPPILEEMPRIAVKWHRAWSKRYYNVVMDKVLRSAWCAPNGDIGIVLYNIGEEPLSLTLVLDPIEYGILEKFFPLYSDDQSFSVKQVDGKYQLSVMVPSRMPVILELRR